MPSSLPKPTAHQRADFASGVQWRRVGLRRPNEEGAGREGPAEPPRRPAEPRRIDRPHSPCHPRLQHHLPRATLNGVDCAIRLNTNSKRSLRHVLGELAWTSAIAAEDKISAPRPASVFGGLPWTTTEIDGLDRQVPILVYHWLPGRHVARRESRSGAEALGRLMHRLHDHGRHFAFPAGTERPALNNVLDELPWTLPELAIFRETEARANAVLKRLGDPSQVIHFDLHFGNVKRDGEQFSVFDFDDSVISHPAVDAAQAMYYLRGRGPEVEPAFWHGLQSSPEQLGVTRGEFEWLVGGRQLLLATDLMQTNNRDLAELAARYIEVSQVRLEHLAKTGTFEPSVARVS